MPWRLAVALLVVGLATCNAAPDAPAARRAGRRLVAAAAPGPAPSLLAAAAADLQQAAPGPRSAAGVPAAPQQQPSAAVAAGEAPGLGTALDLTALPPWATDPSDYSECTGQRRQQEFAAQQVRRANERGRRLDLAIWGDSIANSFNRDGTLLDEFGDLPGGAQALAMCSSSVGELAWRLLAGGEAYDAAVAPAVAVLLIGTNNLRPERALPPPAPQLDWIVRWMRQAWPDTQVVVSGLLPMLWPGVAPGEVPAVNAAYASVAARRGAAYIDCGAGLDPADGSQFEDGVHPTPSAQLKCLACLRAAVQPALDAAAARG